MAGASSAFWHGPKAIWVEALCPGRCSFPRLPWTVSVAWGAPLEVRQGDNLPETSPRSPRAVSAERLFGRAVRALPGGDRSGVESLGWRQRLACAGRYGELVRGDGGFGAWPGGLGTLNTNAERPTHPASNPPLLPTGGQMSHAAPVRQKTLGKGSVKERTPVHPQK